MQKIVLTFILVIALSTACKRNYTCTCTVLFGGTNSTTATKFNNTKANATGDCNALNSTTATQTVSCSLN